MCFVKGVLRFKSGVHKVTFFSFRNKYMVSDSGNFKTSKTNDP